MSGSAGLVGRWTLTAWETRLGVELLRPLGEHPSGTLIYCDDGWMAVHVSAAGRAAIPTVDPLAGSMAERADAYSSHLSYCGRYELTGERVLHTIQISSFPNWAGIEQVRLVSLDRERLVLRTPPIETPAGTAVSELHWRRAGAGAEPG